MLGPDAAIVADYALNATVPLSSLALSGTGSVLDAGLRPDLGFAGVKPYTIGACWSNVHAAAAVTTEPSSSRYDVSCSSATLRASGHR